MSDRPIIGLAAYNARSTVDEDRARLMANCAAWVRATFGNCMVAWQFKEPVHRSKTTDFDERELRRRGF